MRDVAPFEALKKITREVFVPRMRPSRTLRVWSAGCSSGEEPYSITVALAEILPDFDSCNISVKATDSNKTIPERAKAAVYQTSQVNRGMPITLLLKHFDQSGRKWRVKRRLRSKVTLKLDDIARQTNSIGSFDIVFLRNVLNGFGVEDRKRILTCVRRNLLPNGFLFVGSTESIFGLDPSFVPRHLCDTMVYHLEE